MLDNWTFGKRVGAGFALAGAILVVIAVVGFRTSESLIENDRLVEHTHEVRRALAELAAQVARAEGAMRGYVITSDGGFLEPYRIAVDASKSAFETVRSLTADNPAQQRRLDALRPVVDERIAHAQRTIDARAVSLDAATELVVEPKVRQMTNDI